MSNIEWQFFPKYLQCPKHLIDVVDLFENNSSRFCSSKFHLESNKVLEIVRPDLESKGFSVEKSKKADDKITVPVLYGRNGKLEKSFYADGYNKNTKTVIEVEAGRAVANYQFLKDLFQAIVMVDVDYCIIAVRRIYKDSKDFDSVIQFMDTLFTSNRIKLPLLGVLIIGY